MNSSDEVKQDRVWMERDETEPAYGWRVLRNGDEPIDAVEFVPLNSVRERLLSDEVAEAATKKGQDPNWVRGALTAALAATFPEESKVAEDRFERLGIIGTQQLLLRTEQKLSALQEAVGDIRARASRCRDLDPERKGLNRDGHCTAKASAYEHAAEIVEAALDSSREVQAAERIEGAS